MLDRRRALIGGIVLAVMLAGVYFGVSARAGTVEDRAMPSSIASAAPAVLDGGNSSPALTPLATSIAPAPASPTSTPGSPGRTATPQPPAIAASLPITTTQLAECGASAARPCVYDGLLRSGRLAFLDAGCVLTVINPGSGQHWQSSLDVGPDQQRFETTVGCQITGWSQDTSQLRAWVRYPDENGTDIVFSSDGRAIQQVPGHRATLDSKADGNWRTSATLDGDGRAAWFEHDDRTWFLKVESPSGAEMLDLPFAADDRIHKILTWVPATDLLLVKSIYASSGAMLYGGLLSTVDVTTGVTREIGLRTRWGDGEKSWNPLKPTIVDLIVTGTDREHSQAQQLAELDLGTGQIEYLTETSAHTPLWSPDGTLLAYAMNLSDDPRSLSEGGDSRRSVIVIQDRYGTGAPGEPKVVASGDAVIGWTADGAVLIYGRYADAERSGLELRAMTVDGGSDQLIAANVHVPPRMSQCFWCWGVTYQP